MQHHAFVIPAGVEEGIVLAQNWIEEHLQLHIKNNPDVAVSRYGLFSVEDAREVVRTASQAPMRGDTKAIVIAASRVYHEAQNALLKLFEEPPKGTYLFLVVPSVGVLLPTLRSRVEILDGGLAKSHVSEAAEDFLRATKEKRSAIIKKLTTGKDDDERREHRDTAVAIVDGVEVVAYAKRHESSEMVALLEDTQTLRSFLQDRAAPVKMVLEHLSLVLPKGLL